MKAIGIFLLLISPCFVFSQDMSQDFGTWTKIKSDFKINKKTSFINKTELRTLDNSSQISQFYTQISLNKKLNKKLSTSFGSKNIINTPINAANIKNHFFILIFSLSI